MLLRRSDAVIIVRAYIYTHINFGTRLQKGTPRASAWFRTHNTPAKHSTPISEPPRLSFLYNLLLLCPRV